MWCLGSWYRKSELSSRSGLFVMSGVIGQMFSGYLQAALFTGMHGKGGMSAWRWLFIFDFILAIPVAIYGFVSESVSCDSSSADSLTRSAFPTPHIKLRPSTSMSGKESDPARGLRKRAVSPPERWTGQCCAVSLALGRSTRLQLRTLSGR